jgi:hypothetical protein
MINDHLSYSTLFCPLLVSTSFCIMIMNVSFHLLVLWENLICSFFAIYFFLWKSPKRSLICKNVKTQLWENEVVWKRKKKGQTAKTSGPSVFRFCPVQIQVSSFKSGSCAERFWGILGPVTGPVSGSTGQSGFHNLDKRVCYLDSKPQTEFAV